VNVQSADPADIFVSVTDKNTAPPQIVMNQVRLDYGSAAIVIAVQEDVTGQGNIDWTAVRCDDMTHSRMVITHPLV
jgi:hypothetical protein